MIKRIITVLLLLLMVLGCSNEVQAVEKIIRVAGDRQYPPYEFIDANGNYRGFNVDVMRAIALEKGLTLEFYPLDWHEAQVALLQGKVDVIQGMTYSERRSELYSFANPIVINAQAIFVHKSVNTIATIEDLAGKKVAVQKGDIAEDRITRIKGIILYEYATQDEAVQALIKNEVDAFVGNELTGWYLLEKWRRLGDFKQVGYNFYRTRYGPVVRPGDTETISILNDGLKTIKKKGTYDNIYRKWFGKSYTDNNKLMRVFSVSVLLLAVSVVVIGLGLNNINRGLKQKVEERTSELKNYANVQEAILRNSPNGIITLNSMGMVTSNNPAASQMLGMECMGLHYREVSVLSFLSHGEMEKIFALHHTLRRTVRHKGRILQLTVNPIIDLDGKTRGLLVNIDDITAERQLAEKNWQEARIKTLSTLAAGMAHEIRNPLTSIKTYIDLLPDKINSPVFQKRLLDVIPREINRIEQLIYELIDYARPRPSASEQCDLQETLGPVLELASIECEDKGVEFRHSLRGSVYCDQRHLKQIVLNLLLNSLKATPPGGKIAIVSVKSDDWVRLIVNDSGCGIPPEHFDQVFDPFFSLQGGSGLGLAMVHQMVMENGGFITFTSKLDKGTRFNVWLPSNNGGPSDG